MRTAQKSAKGEKPAATAPAIEAIKGFNHDWTCRGFQYEIGKTYTLDGKPVICEHGFHAVEMPLDAWSYYGPVSSVFATVSLVGDVVRHERQDSKVASASITIKAEIKLPELIKRAVDWVLAKAVGNTATGDSGHAAATGERGHAAATGYRGHAAATGDGGHAAATGDGGHAAATGDSGHAAATGERGHAAATGYRGHAAATGDSGHAAATGDSGHAAATGDGGHAAATGCCGHAAATGDGGHAAATGCCGHAAATGEGGHAAATGDSGHAAATGERGIAASLGPNGSAKAGSTGWLVLALWRLNGERYELLHVRTAKVGGPEGIKANVAYSLNEDGEFVERGADQ